MTTKRAAKSQRRSIGAAKRRSLDGQVRSALQQVLDYREGKGRFNLSHITDRYERDNVAHDLWYEVEADVRAAIDALSTPNDKLCHGDQKPPVATKGNAQ